MMRRVIVGTGALLATLVVPACGPAALTGAAGKVATRPPAASNAATTTPAASHAATTTPAASHAATTTPAASRATTTTAATCLASQLTLGFGPPMSPMTGEHAVAYRLTNHGPAACRLYGYPSVTLLGAGGAPLAFHDTRGRSQYVTHAGPTQVTVAPRGSAYLLVAKYRCDLGTVADAETVELGLPEGGSLTGPVAPAHGAATLALCRGGPSDPGQDVDVSPFEPTARATGPA